LIEVILVSQRLKGCSGLRHDQPEEQRIQGEHYLGIFQLKEWHHSARDGQQEHKEIMLECGDEFSPGGSTCLHSIDGKIMSYTATHASTV